MAGEPRRDDPVALHVLSDSTGNLARHMVAAFLTQFRRGAFRVAAQNFLEDGAKLRAAVDRAIAEGGIVLHALVRPAAKQHVERACRRARMPCRDLTGDFVQFLARSAGLEPSADVERLHETTPDYHERIKALEFTLEHDDGLGLESLAEAQVVVVGVSRTSKTPTSIYLAQQGYRVANVSLAVQVEPPAALLALPPGRVVGLVIDPMRLVEIRQVRQAAWHVDLPNYATPDDVAAEVQWSRRLFRSRGWAVIDVTHKAIEETAARIVDALNLPRPPQG